MSILLRPALERRLRRLATVFLASVATLMAASALVAQQQPAQARRQPNIVMFIADDLGANDIGPYGNVVVRTPSLDALAGESMVFTRAFAPSPTCSPSRSSMYTGLMPFRAGAHANHSMVRPGTLSIVQRFEAVGYRVALAGKLHVGPEEVFPFELVPNTNVPEPGHENDGVLWTNLNMAEVDRWLGSVDRNRPFVLLVADHSPHVAWPEVAEYDPAEVDIPANHIDTPEYRTARARYYTDVTKMDRNVGLLLESLRRHRMDNETMVVFTADQGPQLAFGKWGLYDLGVRAPLIVRWPGRVAASHTNAMVSLVDLLPTFVEAVGGAHPTDIDGRSFLPVLTGSRQAHRDTVYATHTGDGAMNRTPMRMVRTTRYKYILNLGDTIYTTHMDRARVARHGDSYWGSWVDRSFYDPAAAATLYRYHHRPPEELYDLETDPLETRNLAAWPAYADVLGELRRSVAAWREQQGDRETGPEKLEGRPAGPPYIPR